MQFIDLQAQYQHLKAQIDRRISQVLNQGHYILGPEVSELESQLADYVGVKHCITCANGTDALQLALMAMDIGPGDAVFCPTFTFFASAEVISLVGATPVFVDVDPHTYNICPQDLERKIQQIQTQGKLSAKAIIAVDLFGLPADYSSLSQIAKRHNLRLIEDGAQGFGGKLNGKVACSFGDLATTSFFPAKPLGCYGDGGALFTNNNETAELLRSLRLHGKGQHKYDNVRIGLNSRLDTIQAAVLLEKLTVFPTELERRNQAAQAYSSVAAELGFITPHVPEGYYSSWAQYCLQAEERDKVMHSLNQAGVPTMIYYQTCMHQQTVYKALYQAGDFPIAESLAQRIFSLPMHGYLTEQQLEQIISALQQSS
ncbi:DegT/DnrJ/EryC1/StrS family aminotransferase [Bowmanella yangjiangensis]|uniref:DegT/DnrJ/EryC1/StrS family aminotransferase n=1 Tax=Bowmanella yangjiangensis TaxID=2811230 RepID=A0ABS3CTB9_9ALTE|nr:DegT/DnrJ/EryC1/StrS family aminotransferase [Bowmanella yangjiangensis]MBN7820372.1 DegT/DnrJ/EryC1/StrS family aminotransferase [Bowmanella yangjiangensis]